MRGPVSERTTKWLVETQNRAQVGRRDHDQDDDHDTAEAERGSEQNIGLRINARTN
jgi:hypothetical protein